MKLRSLWRAKVRLIRCKSQKSLERMEEKLIKMNKRVAIVDKRGLLNIVKNDLDISRVNVLLVLDEEF